MPRPTKGLDTHIYDLLDYTIPFCKKYNIHPNTITIINIINSVFLYYNLKCFKNNNLIICQIILHLLLDCLDGEVARQCNKQSKLGGYLDSFGDIYFISIILLYILKKYFKYNYFNNKLNVLFTCIPLYYISCQVMTQDTHESKKYLFEFLLQENLIIIFLIVIILLFEQ